MPSAPPTWRNVIEGQLSLRDAIHLANITAGTQEIWLPAWEFILIRNRLSNDALDVEYGDLEIVDSVIIRGVDNFTRVTWSPTAAADKGFELIGDYIGDGDVDNADDLAWNVYKYQFGTNLPADGNDDGYVGDDDLALTEYYFGTSLNMTSVLLT